MEHYLWHGMGHIQASSGTLVGNPFFKKNTSQQFEGRFKFKAMNSQKNLTFKFEFKFEKVNKAISI